MTHSLTFCHCSVFRRLPNATSRDMSHSGTSFEGGGPALILVRRPRTDPLKHAKPVFNVPGVTHASIPQVVKFVHPYLYLLSGCRHAEEHAKMSS
jgi:hypothetical protein